MTPNATVVDVAVHDRDYAVTIAGTTGVISRCEIPRDLVEQTASPADAPDTLTSALKRCADATVAQVPDGRPTSRTRLAGGG